MSTAGTRLFLTTPNYRSLWPLIERGLDRFALAPKLDGDQHVTHFNTPLLASACRAGGWEIVDIGTFNGVAPFLAPLGQSIALGAETLEFHLRRAPPFNLLYCV